MTLTRIVQLIAKLDGQQEQFADFMGDPLTPEERRMVAIIEIRKRRERRRSLAIKALQGSPEPENGWRGTTVDKGHRMGRCNERIYSPRKD